MGAALDCNTEEDKSKSERERQSIKPINSYNMEEKSTKTMATTTTTTLLNNTRRKNKEARRKPELGKEERLESKVLLPLVANKTCLLLAGGLFVLNLVLLSCAPASCSTAAVGSGSTRIGNLDKATAGSDDGADEGEHALLEAELNSIVRRHELREPNSKQLSEAIISMLMLGNLSEPTNPLALIEGNELSAAELAAAIESAAAAAEQSQANAAATGTSDEYAGAGYISAPESIRLRKLISYLQNYESAQLNGEQFPILPASPAATIKRASAKMSGYLRQQASQRQQNNFGRNNFDFGLGKRPDSGVMNNVLRLGDSSIGHGQAVSGGGGGQLGKRPSHRYDFGLGKRLASVSRTPSSSSSYFL